MPQSRHKAHKENPNKTSRKCTSSRVRFGGGGGGGGGYNKNTGEGFPHE